MASGAEPPDLLVTFARDVRTVADVQLHQVHAIVGQDSDAGVGDEVTTTNTQFEQASAIFTQDLETWEQSRQSLMRNQEEDRNACKIYPRL